MWTKFTEAQSSGDFLETLWRIVEYCIGGRTHSSWICSTTLENKHHMNAGLLMHGFRHTASGRLKKIFSVRLEFPCRHCRRQTSGTLISPTVSDWGYLPWFPTKWNILTELLKDVDLQTEIFMVHPWCWYTTFSSCSSGIPEQRVSGITNRTDERTAWPTLPLIQIP